MFWRTQRLNKFSTYNCALKKKNSIKEYKHKHIRTYHRCRNSDRSTKANDDLNLFRDEKPTSYGERLFRTYAVAEKLCNSIAPTVFFVQLIATVPSIREISFDFILQCD